MKSQLFFRGTKIYIWHSVKKLGNLTFAINLLLYIAALSIVGTIIEQNRSLEFYIKLYSKNNKILGIIDWKAIQFLQLDHIYTSWWFISLIVIFGSSLSVCTVSRQLPMLKSAKQWKFYSNYQKLLNFSHVTPVASPSLPISIFILNKKEYHVFQQDKKIYAYKNLIGRIAPIFVHLSIILLLLGSLLGFFGGILIQEMIPEGETMYPQNIISSANFSYLQQQFLMYINKFSITYYYNNSIKQFISNIYLFNYNGRKLIKDTLQVNKPIYFRNVTIYQTDWGIVGLRLQIQQKTSIQILCQQDKNNNNKIWVSTLKISDNKIIYILMSDLTGKLYIYNTEGKLINSCYLRDTIKIDTIYIYFNKILTKTGLQIKTDPGTSLVYASFGMLITSTILSYTSYSQIWLIYRNDEKFYFGGKTNRASLNFEEDLKKIRRDHTNAYETIMNIIQLHDP